MTFSICVQISTHYILHYTRINQKINFTYKNQRNILFIRYIIISKNLGQRKIN